MNSELSLIPILAVAMNLIFQLTRLSVIRVMNSEFPLLPTLALAMNLIFQLIILFDI